jgi:hypothetical protein
VYAIAVPAGYELRSDDEDTLQMSGVWDRQPFAAVPSYIEYLPEAVAARIRAITPHFLFGLGEEGTGDRWTNHCGHCGISIDQEELFEVEGPFGLIPATGAEAIQLHRIREPLEAWAGGQSHDLKSMDS